jgi:gliding motility-associated-like protein
LGFDDILKLTFMKATYLFSFLLISTFQALAQVNPGNVGTANLTAWFRPDNLPLGDLSSWTSTWPSVTPITLTDSWGTGLPVATNTPANATSNYNTTVDFIGNSAGTLKILGNQTNLNLLNNNFSGDQGTMIVVYHFPSNLLPNNGHVVQYREANSGGDGIQFRGLGTVAPGVGTLRLAIGSGANSANATKDRPVPIRPSISSYTGNRSAANSMQSFYNNAIFTSTFASSTTGNTGLYLGGRWDGVNFEGLHIGFISEVIFYNTNLSPTDRTKVESYLAIKYGITLSNEGGGAQGNYLSSAGTNIWTSLFGASYHNDVIGIARDDAQGLLQKQSHTFDDSCRIYLNTLQPTNVANTGVFSNDASFLLMGHNTAPLCGNAAALAEMPAGLSSRLAREFKVTKTNFTNDFNWDVKIDSCQAISTANLNNIKLLVSTNGDFTNAAVYGVTDGLTFAINNGVVSVLGITNAHVPNNQISYLTIGYQDVVVTLTGPTSVCQGSDVVLEFTIQGTNQPVNVTYLINGTPIPLSNVVNGQEVVVSNFGNSLTYGLQPLNALFNCCSPIPPVLNQVTVVPNQPIPLVAHFEDCGDSTFSWVTWNSFSSLNAEGTINSLFGPASFTVTHSVGSMSSTANMFGSANFPAEYNVPGTTPVLRNDSQGTLTFCFSQPILNPYFLFASIGTPNLSVPMNTSVPYEIVWAGQAVTYQDNQNFTGTEGYNIISFPGWQTCIDVTFLVSEIWTNITIGNYLPNCPADTICEGTGVVLNAGALGTYTWSPSTYLDTTAGNSVVSTPFSNVTYTVTNTNPNVCLLPSQISLVTIPNVTPEFNQVPAICAGDFLAELPTTSNNGVPGTWSPSINNQSTTTYSFTPQACAAPATMTITVNQYETPTFNLPNSICEDTPLSAFPTTSTNNYSGSWSPAPNNQNTTSYTFTPNPGSGCVLPANYTIEVVENVQPQFAVFGPFCALQTISDLPTTSQNGVPGTWSPAINNTATTTYTFTPNPGVCALPASTQIVVNPNPDFNLGPNRVLCPTEVISIGTPDNFASYTWSTGATTPSIQISEGGTYQLLVTNSFGCSAQDEVEVAYLLGCGDLDLPNVFSPNSDGTNDVFSYLISPNITDVEIVILNRWGQVVYSNSDPNVFWNGVDQSSGIPCSEGVYFYKVNYRRIELNESFEKHGFLHLVRN